jgi:Family of unknown function (DUF6459)
VNIRRRCGAYCAAYIGPVAQVQGIPLAVRHFSTAARFAVRCHEGGAVTAASEPVETSQPVLLRLVELDPPPEPDDADLVWRPSFLDRLPVLQPAPRARPESAAVAKRPASAPDVPSIGPAQAGKLAATVARVVLEVLEGRRPPRQLNAVLTGQALATVQVGLAGGIREPVRRASVSTVRVCLPSRHAIESSVVFRCGHRFRALALRLEQHDERWLATALRLG